MEAKVMQTKALCAYFLNILLKSVGVNGHCTSADPIVQNGVV